MNFNNVMHSRLVLFSGFIRSFYLKKMSSNSIDPDSLIRLLPPSLSNNNKHKGQAGRIGIVGGSLEYTGAPYFAAISALKVGADLVHVFCAKEAATVIKSYSPELIVHPLLNVENAVEKIRPWFDRLHVIVMGPGLGREQTTFKIIKDLVKICKINKKPLILDADALIFFHNERDLFKDYPVPIILTPNLMEFKKLTNDSNGQSKEDQIKDILDLSPNLSLVCKGPQDEIFNRNGKLIVSGIGSGRRCGGQGDILSGSLPVFLYWSSLENTDLPINVEKPLIAGYAACRLVRECNQKAFKTKGRSMTASDIINEIHSVFDENFEIKIN